MESSVAVAERSGKASALRVLMWLVPFVGFLIAGWAWALSSPVGSAPDDDYHMASIWCPTPIESSGCLVEYDSTGSPVIKVPALIVFGKCYSFDPNASGECQLVFRGEVQTTRVDTGEYPGGYYDIVHIFAGSEVVNSVNNIRLFNVAVAALLILATVAVTPKGARLPVVVGFTIGIVPLGMFLIASLNPSSWAITGVATAWGATHALLLSDSRTRRILASALLILGAVVAATSRSDAGAFVVVITAGYLFTQYRRSIPWTSVAAVGIGTAIGFIGFLSTRQAGVAMGSMGDEFTEPMLTGVKLLLNNLIYMPVFFAGVFGFQSGLGWLDTPLPGITVITMVIAAGGLIFLGTQRLSLRKVGNLVITIGAATVLALIMFQTNELIVGFIIQPRYLLPLVVVFLMVLLVDAHRPERSVELSGSNRWLLWALVITANTFALQRNIRRYVTGMDEDGFNLNRDIEWWVSAASPLTLWILGSIGFAMFASAILFVDREAKMGAIGASNTEVAQPASQPSQLDQVPQPTPRHGTISIHSSPEALV